MQYFNRHETGGSFIKPNKADFGVDIWTGVEEKYMKNDDEFEIQKNTNDKDQDLMLYNNFK